MDAPFESHFIDFSFFCVLVTSVKCMICCSKYFLNIAFWGTYFNLVKGSFQITSGILRSYQVETRLIHSRTKYVSLRKVHPETLSTLLFWAFVKLLHQVASIQAKQNTYQRLKKIQLRAWRVQVPNWRNWQVRLQHRSSIFSSTCNYKDLMQVP